MSVLDCRFKGSTLAVLLRIAPLFQDDALLYFLEGGKKKELHAV